MRLAGEYQRQEGTPLSHLKQTVTFCRTKDGINLAVASVGHGPVGSKVIEERRTLQNELGKLERLWSNGLRVKGGRGALRGAVAPKYRNPDNPEETWAGRGLKPRWLAAALKTGKKLEDFSITAPAKRGRPAAPKKARWK